MYADSCLCLPFLTQLFISELMLARRNFTPRTGRDLYHNVQLSSVMVYDIAQFCQKCQNLHFIFHLFRRLCCLCSLFLLARSPEIYFPVITNLHLVLKLCFNCVETTNYSLNYFLSLLPPAQHRQELCFKWIWFLGFCSEVHPGYPGPAVWKHQIAQDQGYRNSANMGEVRTTQHVYI